MLYYYAGKNEIQNLPDVDDIWNERNIDYLYSQFAPYLSDMSDIDLIIQKYMPVFEAKGTEEKTEKVSKEREALQGIISFYKKDGGYGMIKAVTGGQIYFHIKQVKDYELQRILQTEDNTRRRVIYTRGINFKGDIAADEIELDWKAESDSAETTVVEYTHQGFIEYYDAFYCFGKIHSNNTVYNFILDNIKDPLLRADICSRFDVPDLYVKFNIKERENQSKQKKEKVAVDIVGVKQYTEEEITDFIKQKYVSQGEVDQWLGIVPATKSVNFREVDYEPLSPLESVAISATPQIVTRSSAPKFTGIAESIREERKAVELLLSNAGENPFEHLERIPDGEGYFQTAHLYQVGKKNYKAEIVGVNLDRAEELYIKAIQANDQVASAVADLANVYINRGGDYVVKGLQLLESYGYVLSEEKQTNVRVQLIDKSGNFEALELILLSAIPRCVKKNTVWQYTAKLAWIYYKRQEWKKAIEWFNKSLDYLDNNRDSFARYDVLRQSNVRSLIISYYQSGSVNKAESMAAEYLKKTPEDPVIASIVNGTFAFETTDDVMEEEMTLQYEDEFLDTIGDEISQYLSYQLDEVNLGEIFNKVNEVYSKIRDGVYTGNSSDVKSAIDYIKNNIFGGRAKRALTAEYRSKYHIGIARIIYDSRNNVEVDSDKKVALDEVKKYLGTYARYTADSFVEKYATIDSIRFLYIQSLRYMRSEDSGNIAAAISMLMSSFFMDGAQLTDELHDVKGHEYKWSHFSERCVSVKDFLIATFMLQNRQEYVNQILNEAYKVSSFRDQLIAFMQKVTGESKIIANYYDFETVWKRVKNTYNSTSNQISREIEKSIDEFQLVESVRQHVSRIEELMNVRLLWNQDEEALRAYLQILNDIAGTYEKYTVDEKIEGFRLVETEIGKLKSIILESPTELSYDYIYSRLDGLEVAIRDCFNLLYYRSQPECKIALSNNSVYVNDKSVEVAITFKNQEDRQDADAVEIELIGSVGADFAKCEKQFTSIRGGEEQEYMAFFTLSDRVIEDGQFEITVNLRYQYRDSVEHICTFTTSEILPVTITDKENFIRIENKYNRIIRGSGVDVNTPELFKGRSALINSICASMSSQSGIMTKNRGIILWGQRRVGKNSVKDYLKEKIKKEYPNAYIIIELGSIGKCRNLREVLITIINRTEDTLMLDYPDIYEKLIDKGMVFDGGVLESKEDYMPEFARFMDRLSARLKSISHPEENIPLYFLDEFSYLYEWIEKGELDGKQFMRFWKSFIQDYGICSIIIAQDNIPVWKSRFENEFACMNHDNEITYLDFEGAKELICEPCQVGNKPLFTDDAVKFIYDLTKGSAYLIVIFCKYVIDYLNENYTEKATKTIVQIVFEREFLDKKEMFLSDDFEPQIQDVANVGIEGEHINRLNTQLLREIASATISANQAKIDDLKFFAQVPAELAKNVFQRLKERKIIEVERDAFCSISMPLLKYYLLRDQALLTRDVFNKLIR